MMRYLLAGTAIVLTFNACGGKDTAAKADPKSAVTEPAVAKPVNPSKAMLSLLEEQAKELIAVSPETATSLGLGEDFAGEGFAARLGDYSLEGNGAAERLNQKFLQEISHIDPDNLSGTAAVSFDVMENAYQIAAERNQFAFGNASILGSSGPYVLTQLSGVHLYLPRLLLTEQPVTNTAEAEDWIARLEEIDRVLGETGARLEIDAGTGVQPPRFALVGIENSLRGFVSAPVAAHPLMTSFAAKADALDGLSDENKAALKARVKTVLTEQVYPAYQNLAETVARLKLNASDEAGIWQLDEGEAFYQHALRSYGGGGLTAEEVHQLGLDEVDRISGEMDTILKGMGYTDGPVGARFAALARAEGMVYPDTDEGKTELLAELRTQVAAINTLAPEWFGTIPPQDVLVKRIPVYEQDSSAGGYYTSPSLDGARPGTYWINLKDTADWPKYTLKTLTYHEAVPGHHFQISSQQAVKDMPLIRNMLFYSEYGEGWALYAEQLAEEMGMYKDDPLGNLGRLQSELFRAARLVVDTGLHHKQWSREEAIDYMTAVTGDTRASVTREIERYAVWPGQATSYKLGMLKMVELRATAEQRLGEDFDIRAFHDAVLLDGSMPLPVLEAKIGKWVSDQCAAHGRDCSAG